MATLPGILSAMTSVGFAAQLVEDLGVDTVRRLVAVFEADVARLTDVLDASSRAGDVASFRRAAHGLAGAAGAVGAGDVEATARIAMSRADLSVVELPALAAELRRAAETALAEFASFVATLPPEP